MYLNTEDKDDFQRLRCELCIEIGSIFEKPPLLLYSPATGVHTQTGLVRQVLLGFKRSRTKLQSSDL
jgi:hypothetical protein